MGFFRKYRLQIKVPNAITIVYFPDKVRFIGEAQDIALFAEKFRQLSKFNDGDLCKLDKLTLKVSNYITLDIHKEHWIELPPDAWNILASKFLDVVDGYEDNPFDFNDCGYTDKLLFDIGIEVTDLPQK